MKYTIEGFNQAYAMTLRKEVQVGDKTVVKKIDCTDLVILRWFVDFYPKMNKISVDGEQYAPLSHNKLLEDLPLIDITKKAFIDRMKKLADFGILSYKFVKEHGSKSYYGFGENYAKLVGDVATENAGGCTVEHTGGIRSNGYGVSVQTTTINKSIIDNSITNKKENYTKENSEHAISIDAVCKYIHGYYKKYGYGKRFDKTATSKKLRTILSYKQKEKRLYSLQIIYAFAKYLKEQSTNGKESQFVKLSSTFLTSAVYDYAEQINEIFETDMELKYGSEWRDIKFEITD